MIGWKVWSRAFLIAMLGACGGDPGDEPDGSSGFDAPVAACPTTPPSASCGYRGYGTPCPVACTAPEDCSFDVTVGWTGGYCCGGGGEVGSETFRDCRCVGGTALCARFSGSSERAIPTTTCEFCERVDAGGPSEPDVPSDDAGRR